MTTLDDKLATIGAVRAAADDLRRLGPILADGRWHRDWMVRRCYAAGNATMAELAKATGLTVQRISQIVRDER